MNTKKISYLLMNLFKKFNHIQAQNTNYVKTKIFFL